MALAPWQNQHLVADGTGQEIHLQEQEEEDKSEEETDFMWKRYERESWSYLSA